MSGQVVHCASCHRVATGAKPVCAKCIGIPGLTVHDSKQLSEADRKYLMWKAAHGSPVQH